PPSSGSLRDILIAVLSNVAVLLDKTPFGGAVAALVGVHDEPDLIACLKRVEARRRSLLRGVLSAARDRNEYPPRRNIDLDIDALLGALYFRALFRRQKPGAAFVRALVDQWLAAQ